MIVGGNQRTPEIHTWISLCLGMGIKTYVELGRGSGYLLRDRGVDVVTIDLLSDDYEKHIQGDSHDSRVLHRALDMLNGLLDCVFIDADHSEDGARQDFALWAPVAGKLVAFHDILMPTIAPFWREVSLSHTSIELVARDVKSARTWQHGIPVGDDGVIWSGGIGVIFKEGA